MTERPPAPASQSRWPVRGWWFLAATSVVVVAYLHVLAAREGTGPIFYTDEVGYLSNAQLIAGVGSPRDLAFSSYYVGWSLLLVPLWWITDDPGSVYTGALALSVCCGVAVLAPLAWIGRWMGLALPQAIIAAGVVAVAPARVVPSNFALSENFLTLLLALTAVAALRFNRRSSLLASAVLGALAAMVFVTHGRMVAVLVATLLWMVARGRATHGRSLVGIAAAVAVAVPGFLLYRYVAAAMYAPSMDREARGLTRLLTADLGAVGKTGIGQAWYVTTAWVGLSVIGLVILAGLLGRESRRRRPGLATWAVLSLAGTVVVSVTWIASVVARGDNRFDIYSYGRYLDPPFAVVAMVGLAGFWVGADKARYRFGAVAAVAAGVVAAFVLLVVPRVPYDPSTWWGPNSVAGLLQWDWPAITAATTPPWWEASWFAMSFVALYGVRARWGRHAVVAALMVAMVVSSVVAQTKTLDPFYRAWYGSFTLADDVEALGVASVSFDLAGTAEAGVAEGGEDTVSRNAYQFWLAPLEVKVFDSSVEPPPTDVVIARPDWDLAEELDAVMIAEDTGMFPNALWLLPGELADRVAGTDGSAVDDGAPAPGGATVPQP